MSEPIRIQVTRFSAFCSPLIGIGGWTPHVEIPWPAFEAALDVFPHSARAADDLRTGDALGLTVPASVRLRAQQTIE